MRSLFRGGCRCAGRRLAPLALLIVAAGTAGQAQVGPAGPSAPRARREALPSYDRRTAAGEPAVPAAVADARSNAAATLRQTVPGVRVERDAISGGPRFIAPTNRFLSGSVAGATSGATAVAAPTATPSLSVQNDPYRPARAFVDQYPGIFGHGSDVLTQSPIRRDYVTRHNGLRTVVWQQQLDGISIFEATFQAQIAARGDLVNVASRFMIDPALATRRNAGSRAALVNAPPITARAAVALAARQVGDELTAEAVTPLDPAQGTDMRQRFQAVPLSDVVVRYVWIPMDSTTVRLAWEVVLTSKARGEMFRIVVDAESGEAIVRHSLTEYISDATYRVFTSDSPSPFSPGHATPSTVQPPTVARVLITTPALNVTASPNGWIDDGVTETRGNNVDAHLDLNADNSPDTPRPQSTGAARVFDPPLDLALGPTAYRDAAVVNLFYWCNWMHDQLYTLGFDEAAGNFQNNNFGRGGLGNDAVQADAQDGSGTDNANFSTPPDGSPGRMQMYVFTGPSPDRDSSLDAEIILHEYTHGLSNRLVGGGVGMNTLQSRGMGEGWSDFYGIALLSEAGDNVAGNYAAGGYVTYNLAGFTENYYYGIRRYPYSTDISKNPLTFRDIDPTQASPHTGVPRSSIIGNTANEVHNMGEVWCVTLWDARANLINKYGFTVGNQRILQLVTDGMKLSPPNPNFLEARDAILQADLVNNGGADRGELWSAFAKRGMGANATSPGSFTSNGVVESFAIPDDLAVSPAGPVLLSGTIGGPFTPGSATYTLTNTGTATLAWTAAKNVAWIDLSATGGTLAPGTSATVTAAINASAASLNTGLYPAIITIANATSGIAQPRSLQLDVQPFTTTLFSETFESGTLDPARWTVSGTNTYRTQVTTGNGPHGGARHLTMDSSVEDSYSRNEATLTLNLAGQQNVVLKFWAKMWDDDPNAPTSNPFTTGADFDGVAISVDGTNWYEVQSLRSPTISNNWALFTVDLDAALSARGLSYNSNFKIRFNQFDNYGIPTDGIAIDDILVNRIFVNRLALTLPATIAENAAPATVTLTATPAPATNLTIALSSSLATGLSVPASVTIPATQATATFVLTPINDGLLNGTRDVTLTAAAPGWASAPGSIALTDDETATLGVTLPSSTTEGAASVTGTVTVSAAPAANVIVRLASSDPASIQPPPTVTIPAGQASATFPLVVIDDNRINGTRTPTITASMTNWTTGQATITVLDNETTALALTTPATVREGDVGVTGSIRISGTLTTNLVVALSSNNTGKLTVPATVTVPAGQTSATFIITVVDNPLADGVVNVNVGASATGFTTANATIAVADNDAHHFAVSPIGATQIRNAPFNLSVTAQDVNGVTITNYNSPITLSAVGSGGTVAITPATASGFVNGVWSGNVAAGTFGTGVVLTAADAGGHTGASNAFNVVTGPLHHFGFGAIATPQIIDTPFALTITAQDAGNNTVAFNGNVTLGISVPDTIEVLSWVGYADMAAGGTTGGGEYQNSKAAISTYFTNYNETNTTVTEPVALAAQLAGKHVFFVPEQERSDAATMDTLGAAWAPVLNNFVNNGGSVVLCSNTTFEHLLFTRSGLLDLVPFSSPVSAAVSKTANTPLTTGVAPSFTGSWLHTYTTSNGTVSLTASPGGPFVVSRDIGAGRAIMIGTDFYTLGTDMDRVLANAISTASTSGGVTVPTRPGTANLTAGVWTGTVSIPINGSNLKLSATAGALISLSNAFSVVPPPPAPTGGATVFTEDFESGAFSSAWTRTGTGNFRTQITSTFGPHGGTRHMTMDEGLDSGSYARNEATLTLNLAGRTGVQLSFWAAQFGDEPEGPPPSPFPTTGADFDGVAISADGGVNWYEVQGLRTLGYNSYSQLTVNLDAAMAARGLSYSSNFKIRFNQYDNFSLGTDGIGIDDILITAVPLGSPITLTAPAQGTEGGPNLVGTITLPAPAASNVTFNLTSNAPAKLTLPATAVVLAGQTTVNFAITLPNDTLTDGARSVVITAAAAAGYQPASRTVTVIDDDVVGVTLTVPATATEGGAPKTGTLTLAGPVAGILVFNLTSSDATTATVPATVNVAPGQSSATFPITILNDNRINGPRNLTFTASATGWTSATASMTVVDDENVALTLNIPPTLREADAPKVCSVSISGVVTSSLVVTLTSSNTAAATVPASVTIPAGQTSANFTLTILDDAAANGPQAVTFTAAATGFTTATVNRQVLDNDAHHFTFAAIGSPQVTNGPIPVIITARDSANAPMLDYNSPVMLSATNGGGGLIITPATAAPFVKGVSNGTVQMNVVTTNVVITATDGLGHTGASNAFNLVTANLDHFVVSTIASPQTVDAPFNVTIRATDAGGTTVPAFNGVANLSFLYGTPNPPIGTETQSLYAPLYTPSHDSRTQMIYLASELGGAARITAIAINVNYATSEVLTNFTIRLK
ncbi:MAG TPA: M36 family metallopeptidase, partial [Opitutaceae bacterium]|nr:M36 family metallopeptidase [Opitutaceae bacterium]